MPNNNNLQAVFLQTGNPLTENRVAGGAGSYDGQVGSRFTVIDPATSKAKRFQLVTMDSAVDVAAAEGILAWWRNATGYVVSTDVSVCGRGNIAGVFGCLVDVTNIGCVQIGGPAPVQFITGTPLDTGLFVIPSATDGKAEAVAAGTAAAYPPLGVTESAATAGVATVTLNLPGRE